MYITLFELSISFFLISLQHILRHRHLKHLLHLQTILLFLLIRPRRQECLDLNHCAYGCLYTGRSNNHSHEISRPAGNSPSHNLLSNVHVAPNKNTIDSPNRGSDRSAVSADSVGSAGSLVGSASISLNTPTSSGSSEIAASIQDIAITN